MAISTPQLTYRYPTLQSGVQSAAQPQIILDWVSDMETSQFSDSGTLNQLFHLMDDATNTKVTLEYVSYTASTRRLIIRPATSLSRGTRYTIKVKNGIADTFGRTTKYEYNWEFDTSDSEIPTVTLLSPPDATVQSVFPTLTWSSVTATGTVQYLVQIDDRWDFGSVDYSTITSSTSITPAGSFDDETTYYWRVLAYNSSSTGTWSDPDSFFYGRRVDSDVSTRTRLSYPATFGVLRTGFANGLTNRASFPTISVTFTSTPSTGYTSHVTFTKKAVIPRNDVTGDYDDVSVAGSWSLSSNTITFTPSEAIEENTRYELTLLSSMENEDGYTLTDDVSLYFTGRYSPLYATVMAIRSRFLSAELQIPDDLINYYIHALSLQANALYYGYENNQYMEYTGNVPTEGLVRDSADLKSYSVSRWVEASASYRLLQSILFEEVRNVGRTTRLGDASVSLDEGFVKGIKEALLQAKGEVDQWTEQLTASNIPGTVSRADLWSPRSWDFDLATMDVETKKRFWR